MNAARNEHAPLQLNDLVAERLQHVMGRHFLGEPVHSTHEHAHGVRHAHGGLLAVDQAADERGLLRKLLAQLDEAGERL
jgi:hypothetical protein